MIRAHGCWTAPLLLLLGPACPPADPVGGFASSSPAAGEACSAGRPWMETVDPGADWAAQFSGDQAQNAGWGLVVADLDGEEGLEVFLPQPGADDLFRLEDGLQAIAIGREPRPDGGAPRLPAEDVYGVGAAAADYDGDGDLDIYVANHGPDALLRNDGAGFFEDVTSSAGIAWEEAETTGASWGDMDGDGDLDLAVAHTRAGEDPQTSVLYGDNKLWENQGDGRFVDRSERLVGDSRSKISHSLSFVDVDGDLDLDLYAANDKGHQGHANALLRNDGHGAYTDISKDSGAVASMRGMGLGVGDINADGLPELLVSDWGRMWLFESDAAHHDWFDSTLARGMALDIEGGTVVAWGPEWVDIDLDGDLDAFVAFGPDDSWGGTSSNEEGLLGVWEEPDALFLQDAKGQFKDEGTLWGIDDPGVGRGFVLADLDGDLAPDLVKRDLWGRATIQRNGCRGGGALEVSVEGTGDNLFGVGARVRVEAGDWSATRWILAGSTGLSSSGPPVASFGTGAHAAIDRVEVTWPDGAVAELFDLEAGQALRVSRP